MIRLASFDIGRCNFAQYVEEFDQGIMMNLEQRYKALPKQKQRRVHGVMTPEIEELLLETVANGKRIQTGVYNFTTEKNQGLDISARYALLTHLARYEELWATCDIIIIEQQYFNERFGKKKKKKGDPPGANVDAIKVGEATFMWFLDRYPFKMITYFSSQCKTYIYGAPRGLSKPERKAWCVEKANEFYIFRQDEDMINLFELSEAVKRKRITTEERVQGFKDSYPCNDEDAQELADRIIREKQKLDDISDTFMQAQAFKFKTMVACF